MAVTESLASVVVTAESCLLIHFKVLKCLLSTSEADHVCNEIILGVFIVLKSFEDGPFTLSMVSHFFG